MVQNKEVYHDIQYISLHNCKITDLGLAFQPIMEVQLVYVCVNLLFIVCCVAKDKIGGGGCYIYPKRMKCKHSSQCHVTIVCFCLK